MSPREHAVSILKFNSYGPGHVLTEQQLSALYFLSNHPQRTTSYITMSTASNSKLFQATVLKGNTLILATPSDWKDWFQLVKSKAERDQIWDLVNPELT